MKTAQAIRLLLLLALGFSGCVPPTTIERDGLRPAFDPSRFRDGEIYEISPQASEIRVLVYRSGPLARLGHNHVISTRNIQGKIYRHQELRYSGMVMQLPVNGFEVDNPSLRAAAGPAFGTMPSGQDIAGTRNNMLSEQVLNFAQYPYIRLVSVNISNNTGRSSALLRITVRDISTDVNIPFETRYEDQRITIKGQAGISQKALGMKPFSILMGAIAVQDQLTVQFDLVATTTAHL